MKLAIEVSKESKAEDGRSHPFVGAVFTNANGEVLGSSFKVDHNRPFDVVDKIRRKLIDLDFINLGTRTTIDGIYIYGAKSTKYV